MEILTIVNSLHSLFANVLHAIKSLLSSVLGGYTAFFILLVSLVLSYLYLKRFTTTPLQWRYLGWYLLLALIFFMLLNFT